MRHPPLQQLLDGVAATLAVPAPLDLRDQLGRRPLCVALAPLK
ncbi:MAG: hypothetical protein M0T80_11415 [Actinomycetota bacterium]|nr:hypothetical protein [Actinomycetota bacterium]